MSNGRGWGCPAGGTAGTSVLLRPNFPPIRKKISSDLEVGSAKESRCPYRAEHPTASGYPLHLVDSPCRHRYSKFKAIAPKLLAAPAPFAPPCSTRALTVVLPPLSSAHLLRQSPSDGERRSCRRRLLSAGACRAAVAPVPPVGGRLGGGAALRHRHRRPPRQRGYRPAQGPAHQVYSSELSLNYRGDFEKRNLRSKIVLYLCFLVCLARIHS
jgi:hypothetical protein